MKTTLLLSFFLILTGIASAQKPSKQALQFDPQLYRMEDSLKNLSYRIVNDEDELVRRNTIYTFIRTLVSTLKIQHSFDFPFDSVKSVSILKSPDNKFRIFTWHLRTDDGVYRYYGAIQKNNPEKLELYALFDNSFLMPNPDTVVNKDSWYGAHYYALVAPKKGKRNKHYILLGWKGNTATTQKKIIEVLSFDEDGKPVFGSPVFHMKDEVKNRIVFEYTTQASMLLRYLGKKKWIVYDHLAPPNNSGIGNYEVYGPDLSYDGLKFKRNKWILMEMLDLRNEKSPMDKLFNDPTE